MRVTYCERPETVKILDEFAKRKCISRGSLIREATIEYVCKLSKNKRI